MMIDFPLFASTFALIFVAELPDKTAFATLLLATRGNPWAIFIGVAGAFLVQTVFAVIFGSFFTHLPPQWVHLAAGILFLVFAVMMWRRNKSEEEESETQSVNARSKLQLTGFGKTVWTSFVLIFIAEWGDLTQLASASLVARTGQPLTVFVAAVLSLWAVTALVIVIGNRAAKIINPALLQKIAAVAFVGVGIYFIVTALASILPLHERGWARGSAPSTYGTVSCTQNASVPQPVAADCEQRKRTIGDGLVGQVLEQKPPAVSHAGTGGGAVGLD